MKLHPFISENSLLLFISKQKPFWIQMCRINYHLLKCVESETDLRQWFRSQNSNSAPFLGLSPDILKWNKILIDEGLVDLLQDVHPFCHFSKHSMNSIQVVQVLPCGHEKLKEDF